MELISKITKAKGYIESISNEKIDMAIVLGSGLGSLTQDIEDKIIIKYDEIPFFPKSTVVGHAGEIIIGNLVGKKIIAFNGRFHFYEGYSMEEVTFPIRVLKALGVEKLLITNAAGGMNPEFNTGNLMIITDHINFIGCNPLIGKNYDELGPRFPDMSEGYNKEFVKLAQKAAMDLNIKVQKGVYVAVSGPNYETPAELRILRAVGGDAVGMSTVPEVIVASHQGMKVLGISCITDMALPDNLQPLDHSAVVEAANKSMEDFTSLIKQVVKNMGDGSQVI